MKLPRPEDIDKCEMTKAFRILAFETQGRVHPRP